MEKNQKSELDQQTGSNVVKSDVAVGMRISTQLLIYTVSLIVLAILIVSIVAYTSGTEILSQLNGVDMTEVMSNFRNRLLIVSIIIIVVATAIAWMISSKLEKKLTQLKNVAQEMVQGKLDLEIEDNGRNELDALLSAFRTVVQNNKELAEAAERMAQGDFDVSIIPRSQEDVLAISMQGVLDEMNRVNQAILKFGQAATEGQLNYRGNTNEYSGAFKNMILALNNVINTFIKPLKVANKAIERIGRGEIPPKITTAYKGDFNDLKENINACIDGLGALTETGQVIHLLEMNDFSTRMEGDYLGIYNDLKISVNEMQQKLSTIQSIVRNVAHGNLSDYDELVNNGQCCEADEFVPSMIQMIKNIRDLVEEVDEMTKLAVAGELDHRGDSSRFNGEYIKVIDGFNRTLDVVIEPIQVASQTLEQLSKGHLDVQMEGDFQGQHGIIKENLNRTIGFLKNYVNDLTAILARIGEGDLSQELRAYYHGDFNEAKLVINEITTRLSKNMLDIDIAAGQVESGAVQISNGAQALSQGTTEQASAIQELSASIDEVAAETRLNAQNAGEANQRAISVRTNAEAGNQQMASMVSAMAEINESSDNIKKIIKVIDDIAFQTNILALNAAVEAARAGVHGKGFAVVAEEVRTLAARSADAARETTVLIEGSIEKVAAGTQIADETAISLSGILSEIEKVTSLVSDIAKASNDQASEIAQITKGIEQVSTVVQSNAATSEESAASSQELSSQAEMLKQMIDTFKLKTDRQKTESIDNPAAVKLREKAKMPAIISMDWETQVAALAADAKALGYQDIAVMDLAGHAKYLNDLGEFDSWDEYWYLAGFKGEAAVSEETVSKVTNQPVIFDVAPIKDGGQVVGLLVGRREPVR
ncbi:MAG: methyl-accepting chemotaxis protein [Eubacteriaceae bacterium]|jgi:methyl-accepting chemotaxis protein|nr:methyl-accepting chemotaxis protein [Eubacteriaceae bacterium]